MRSFGSLLAWAATAVVTTALADSSANVTVALPSNDTFYTAPTNLSSYSNGDIIRSREVPHPLIGIGQYKAAYQLLYRSENTQGNASATVTTVIIPNGGGDPHAIISYQTPEDSSYIGCAPSYQLQLAELDPGIPFLLDSNVIVNIPDYEGNTSAFGAGILAGKGTLDSVRAVLKSTDITGVASNARVALWGYSGGSIATGWAGELQPKYAPELDIAAIAVGGFVANLSAVMYNINEGPNAGYIPAVMLGILTQYPELSSATKDLKASMQQAFFDPLNQCNSANLKEFAGQDIFNYFTGGEKFFDQSDIVDVLHELTMGKSAMAKAPILVYEGMKDEIVPIDSVDTIVSELCHEGSNIRYYKNPDTDHVGTALNGFLVALDFLMDALNGEPVPPPTSGCTTVTTKFTIDLSFMTGGNGSMPSIPMATGTGNAATSAVASITGSSNSSTTAAHSASRSTSGSSKTAVSSIALVLALAAVVI